MTRRCAMFRTPNHTGPPPAGKPPGALGPRIPAALLAVGLAVLILLSPPACRSTPPPPEKALPPGLPVVMREFRVLCREVERARLVGHEERIPPLARALVETASRMASLPLDAPLARKAAAFHRRAEALARTVETGRGNPVGSVNRAFGRLVDGCIDCHLAFRKP